MAEPYELTIPVEMVEALSAFTCEVDKRGAATIENRDRIWLDDGYLVACSGTMAAAYPVLPEGDKRVLGIPSGILDACKAARKGRGNKVSPPPLVLQVTPHDPGPDATVVIDVAGKDDTLTHFRLLCKRTGCPPWGRRMGNASKGKRVWFGIGSGVLERLAQGVRATGAAGLHIGVPLIPTADGWWEGVVPGGSRNGFQEETILVRSILGGHHGSPVAAGWSGLFAPYLVGGVDGIDPGAQAMSAPCPIWRGSMLDENAAPAIALPEGTSCAEPVASPPPPVSPEPPAPTPTRAQTSKVLTDLCAAWDRSEELREIVNSALVELKHQGKL